MNRLPKAKTENIVVQNLNDEVLIYDTITNQAICLNDTAAKVFNRCDGQTSFDELQAEYKYTDELIYLALDELKKQNLLDSATNYQTPFAGMSRREAVRKVGFATMIALPIISSIIAPTSANASSGGGGTIANCQVCTANSQCVSGKCRAAFPSNGTSICAAASTSPNNTIVGSPGASFGAINQGVCSSSAGSQCCNGSTNASFSGQTCTCG